MKSKMKMHYFCPLVAFVVLYLHAVSVDAASSLSPGERFRIGGSSYRPGVPDSSDESTGGPHPCLRTCTGAVMTCHYHFNIEWYHSMSKACFDCPFNITHCEARDCVVGNGVRREITAINRMMPGPSIEVCHGDTIIVHVKNDLQAATTSIHWHGVHQIGTPYMDGVPFVTQCPISPESTFTYKFNATHAGTHFWHAHIGLQRGDGISGALIVRKPIEKEFFRRRYDIDSSEHVILLQDWTNETSQTMFLRHFHAGGGIDPSSLLINGVGKFEVKDGDRTAMTKTPTFNVEQNKRYRFRIINAGFSYCPVEVSIENHEILAIASDGWYIEPVTAKSLVLFAGERFDFILRANQDIDNYWFKFRGVLYCDGLENMRQAAILHYNKASLNEPGRPVVWEERGLQINPVNAGEEQFVNIPISKLRYAGRESPLKKDPDHKFYIAYDLFLKNNDHFNRAPSYGIGQVNDTFAAAIPQINYISMQIPTSPLLVTRPSSDAFCNASTAAEKSNVNSCKDSFCQCPHVLLVKLNSTVEVVIIDEGVLTDENHPLHLHGHSFRVIAQKRLGNQTTLADVMKLDEDGKIDRNLRKPPIKDTVAVPDGGYTIIRFEATNPGYWLFHCHIEYHAEVGMALVFKVGEHEDMPPVPEGFPSCGNYANDNNVGGGFGSSGRNGNGQNGVGGFGNNGRGGFGNGNSGFGNNGRNNVYAQVTQQFNAFHSVVEMPMGGEMEIVYRPKNTGN